MIRKFILFTILTLNLMALDIADIKIMRESNALIAFPNERTAHKISSNMTPSKLMKVNYIKLNNQSLYFLPSWLPQMKNLERLELKNTKIDLKELKKLTSLTKLTILDISDNPIFKNGGELTEILSHFNLNELYASNIEANQNNLKDIGSLSSLVKLDISNNQIADVYGLHLEKLHNLKVLRANSLNLNGTLYPNELPRESLKELYLSGNNFCKIKFNGDFPSLEVLEIANNQQYYKFDDKYNNPYLFKHLLRGAFNKDIDLPNSIVNRLGIKDKFNKFFLSKKSKKYKNIMKTIYQNNKNYIDSLSISSWDDEECSRNTDFILSAKGEMRLISYYYLFQSKQKKPINYAEFRVNKYFKDIFYDSIDEELFNTFLNIIKEDSVIRESIYKSLKDYQIYYHKFIKQITKNKAQLLNEKRKKLDSIWEDEFTAEEFYNEGFEKSSDKCYATDMLVKVNDHKYSFYTSSLDSHYYMFWLRRYNDNTIKFVHFFVDMLVASMEKFRGQT